MLLSESTAAVHGAYLTKCICYTTKYAYFIQYTQYEYWVMHFQLNFLIIKINEKYLKIL